MSRRRAAVIAWAMTAAALYGAVGTCISAPASADDSGRRVGADASGGAGSSNGDGPRRHGRFKPDLPSGGAGSSNGEGPRQHGRSKPDLPSGGAVSDREDPCPWWPTPRPVPPPVPTDEGNRGNRNGLLMVLAATPAIPVPRFDVAAEPVSDIEDTPDAVPAAVGVAPAPLVSVVPAPAPVAGYPAVTAAGPGPRRAPVIPPPAVPVPERMGTPVPPPLRPEPGTESPTALRLGYPDELRDADLAKVLSVALPGLAALAAMTAFGGAVGYRQAKAGYLLRAAGAGRFLQ